MFNDNTCPYVPSVCLENKLHSDQGKKRVEKHLGLNILYTNTDYLPNKLEEVETFAHANNVDVIALVETLDKTTPIEEQSNINFILPGYKTFHKHQGRGLCLFVKESLNVDRLDEIENLFDKSIFCKISTNKNEHLIIGIHYRSPNSSELDNKNLLEQINIVSNKCLKSGEKLVLVGDYNFKSINWADESCSARTSDNNHNDPEVSNDKVRYDDKFLSCIQKNYLTQFVDQPTHHKPNTAPSLIDLILANDPEFVVNLNHHPAFGMSHHFVITFSVSISTQKPVVSATKKYLFHKGDFQSIRKELNETDWVQVIDDKEDINACWNRFVNVLMPLCDKYIPKKTNVQNQTRRNFKAPDTLLKFLDLKRKAFKLSKKFPTSENQIFYNYMRNRVNAEVTKAKKAKELDIAKKVKSNPKALFQYVASKTKPREAIPNLQTHEGKLTSTNKEKAQVLNEFFGSVFTKEDDNELPECNFDIQVPLTQVNITTDDVYKVLNGLKPNKSPGPDLIHPRILKELAKELSLPLKRLFDRTLAEGKIPDEWKSAEVRPIHKKGSRASPDNYRPVSLTSVVCKIFETFIRNALYQHLVSNKLLSPQQYGFCEGRSTVTQLLATINDWMMSLDSRVPVDAVYLDFSKAFDSVPHRRLLHKLHEYGIRGKLLKWIEDFLSDRTQFVSIDNEKSSTIDVTSGVPQGSVLGPTLFIYYINDLPDMTDCKVKIFADDSKIYQELSSPEDQSKLQEGIDALVDWSRTWLMKFNSNKCKVLHLGKNNPNHTYTMSNGSDTVELGTTSCEKDLGVYVDPLLEFDKHIDECTKKGRRMSGMIVRNISHKCNEIMIPLYSSFVRPHLEYANTVWHPYKRKNIDKVEKVQRHFTKTISGLSDKKYPERLKILKLPSIEFRQFRGDMIEVYKLTHNLYDPTSTNTLFKFSEIKSTRQHPFKLIINSPPNTVKSKMFFSNRVTHVWNSLPADLVCADSTNSFKNKFDAHFRELMYCTKLNPYFPYCN